MKTYKEKLRDPRWQKKRLLAMERENFRCSRCGSEDSTLHVHHIKYIFGRDPWDYPFENLITLCEKCHCYEHGILPDEDQERVWHKQNWPLSREGRKEYKYKDEVPPIDKIREVCDIKRRKLNDN